MLAWPLAYDSFIGDIGYDVIAHATYLPKPFSQVPVHRERLVLSVQASPDRHWQNKTRSWGLGQGTGGGAGGAGGGSVGGALRMNLSNLNIALTSYKRQKKRVLRKRNTQKQPY